MNDYKKRSMLNILTDLGGKVLILLMGIVLPKLYVENFGSEVNGLILSVNNMLVYANLIEAGIGGAATHSLYKAVARMDISEINGIMSATNKFYKRTGMYFVLLICILCVVYPYFVTSNLSFGLISCLLLLSAIPSAIKYFFQGKYTILLNADNRAYILNIVSLITTLLTNFSKIILILGGFDVVIVQISYAIISMVQLLILHLIIKRKYKHLDFSVQPNTIAISKSKYVIVHTISATIFSNIDVLALTFFCDFKTVSVYGIYHMIFLQIGEMIKGISNGVRASFGQIYSVDKKLFRKKYTDFKIYYRFIAGTVILAAAMSSFPFVRIYAKNFNDGNYIDPLLPILFFLANYLDVVRWPEVVAVNCTGFFRETSRQAIIETLINLTLSIALVQSFGIYGVLLATVCALSYRTIGFFAFVSKNLTGEGVIKDVIYLAASIMVSLGLILLAQCITPVFYSWSLFLLYGMISVVVCSILYVLITLGFYGKRIFIEFGQIINIAKNEIYRRMR